MKLLVTGATGLVGRELLILAKHKSYSVHFLTTSREKLFKNDGHEGFYWNPARREIDLNCLKGVDAIIHLAGASVSKKWSKSYKQELENSRIQSMAILLKALRENEHQIKYFSTASALGIYPSSRDRKYMETETEINPTFLGKLVDKIEQEADKFEDLGLLVSKLRIGLVLAKNGGALNEMIKPIQLGFGAALGGGEQYISWIHVQDLANMFLYVIEQKLSGSYNAVAPSPITNGTLTRAIAKELKKPLWLPKVPAFVLKLLLGEMSAILLESQYLVNDKIIGKGFVFKQAHLPEALRDCLG